MRSAFTHRLSLAALMCALTAVCALIQIPLPPVPLSLALFGVHMTGALLGGRWGACSLAAYVLLGGAGLPVFAGFAGGPAALFGPTGGFLFGYIPCAALTGFLTRRLRASRLSLSLSMIPGTLVCYALGTAYFMLSTGSALSSSLALCVLPFLPGDALKILLCAHLYLRLQKPLRALGLL